MSNPFHDWSSPARPYAWAKDYYKQPHVVAIDQAIKNWNDGLITTAELNWIMQSEYAKGYSLGLEDAHYPVPAIPYACAIHSDVVQIAEAVWFEGELEFELIEEYDKD